MRATMKKSKIVSGFKRLMSNERGNMAIVVGMATVPMILIMGAAVDFENASNTHTELQSAVDSAALYAASLDSYPNDVLTRKSKFYFNANFSANGSTDPSLAPTYNVTTVGDSITATASVPVNNAFMKIAQDIRPVTYLKAQAAALLDQVNRTHRPVVITQSGEPRAVLQDAESFEQMRAAIGILKLIAQGEQEIRARRARPQREVFERLERRLKQRNAGR